MSALSQDDLDDRRELRWPLRLAVKVRTPDLAQRAATMVELSPHGCRLELPVSARPGQVCLIAIPGLSSRAGALAWSDGIHCGFSFEAPLHIAVVDHLVRTNPAAL